MLHTFVVYVVVPHGAFHKKCLIFARFTLLQKVLPFSYPFGNKNIFDHFNVSFSERSCRVFFDIGDERLVDDLLLWFAIARF